MHDPDTAISQSLAASDSNSAKLITLRCRPIEITLLAQLGAGGEAWTLWSEV